MLREAALLELDLLLAALDEGLVLKDASPYNVQWRGSKPVFVDVGSFERLREGEPWAGYRQFCMLVLYPLLLQAYKNVPFQPWLRGSLEGIEPGQMRALMGFRDRFRRGVLTNVVLHARLEGRYADREVKSDLKKAGFHAELIRANARKLRKLVERLRWEPGRTAWSGYGETTPYDDADAAAKEEFVRESAGRRRRRLLWDLGCNDGRYTRIAAAEADYTVAVDADAAVVEAALPRASRRRLGDHPPADRERGRPVAGPRVARRGAPPAGRPEPSRPDALPRARPPRLADGQRPGSGPSWTGSPTSARRW